MNKTKSTFTSLFIASMFTMPYSFAYENSKTDEEISVIDRGGKVTGGGVKEIEKKMKVGFFTMKR